MAHEVVATIRVALPDPASQPKAYAEILSAVSGAWANFLVSVEDHFPSVTLTVDPNAAEPPKSRKPYARKPDGQPSLPVQEDV